MEEEGTNAAAPRVRGCLKRLLKLGFWGLLIVITLTVLGFQLENRGGARAWEEVRQEIESDGETLDYRAIVRVPVPDEDNFCAIPLLHGIGMTIDGELEKGAPAEQRQRLSDLDFQSEKNRTLPEGVLGHGYQDAVGADLAAWAEYFRETQHLPMPETPGAPARDLLEGLKKFDPVIEELAAGISRPHAQFAPPWVALLGDQPSMSLDLPHYNPTMTVVKTMSLRAIAAARAGEADIALESLLIGIKLAEAAGNEGVVVGTLVAVTDMAILWSGVWETLDAQVLDPEQLARLQGEIEKIDYHEMLLRAMRVEMAFGAEIVDWAKEQDGANMVGYIETVNAAGIGDSSSARWMSRIVGRLVGLAPEGWFDFNKARLVGWKHEYYVKALKSGSLRAIGERQEELNRLVREAKESYDPHALIAVVSMPIFEKLFDRFIYGQSLVNEAVAACAVERYYAERAAYPARLGDLVPDYVSAVPEDPKTGEPLGYRRDAEGGGGRYRLWTVGWDGEDDGGERILDEERPEKTKYSSPKYVGDWVWSYGP